MTPYAPLTARPLSGKLPKSKKVFDNSKVTDHHAIIPTGESPSVLIGNERKLYHLIALRFISAFYPDCTFSTTTVTADIDGQGFKATGKVITSPGWREVYAGKGDAEPAPDSDNSDESKVLPPFTLGESGPHEPLLQKKTTQPPKQYTEGTLLRAMESAGKTVDDEALREAMKENGIGRPSTRAAIIETLFKRGYIMRQRKNIIPTQAGLDLIDTINEPLIKSAQLTGIWENKLRRIERGDYSAREFIDELKAMISEIVGNVMRDNSQRRILVADGPSDGKKEAKEPDSPAEKAPRKRAPAIKSLEAIVCPECGKGHILKGRAAYGCSRYAEGCGLRLGFDSYPADLTPAKLNQLIKKQFRK